jgi:hypothetical protein
MPAEPAKRLTKKTKPSETTYGTPTPLPAKRLTKKTKPSETNYGTPTPIQRRAVSKIVRMFGRSIKMRIVKSTDALKKNTHSIDVQPSYVGRNQTGHVEALLEKAYHEAKKRISYTYKVYAYMKFPSQHGGDDFEVRSSTYNKADAYRMLGDVIHKARDLLQSDHDVKLKDFHASFQFIKVPAGGTWSVSRERSDILKKTSVNTVTNNDSNCFWYALTMLTHSTHKDIKCIKMGRKIRSTLAKELCTKCDFEWDKEVSFEDIHRVELKLKVRILILDMEQIPILNTTSSIYNSLMYMDSSHKFNATYWLLHDKDHYHSINNIKGFLAIDYFCHECLHGFHIKKNI